MLKAHLPGILLGGNFSSEWGPALYCIWHGNIG